jgi:predicted GTPase
MDVPTRKKDEEVVHYDIEDATESQAAVLYKVLGKIQEWMSWEIGDKKERFVPLWIAVKGAAGTGKSFIINTIFSYLRRMFDDNDVVHVVAPTGMAAFNVLGKTLHRVAGLDWKNTKK